VLDSHTKALMLDIADAYKRIAKAYEDRLVRIEHPR
jgi:hypothetical protein